MRRILMPASGHPSDEYDSVHILLENGRVPCGRVFSENLHTDSVETITCELCKEAYERKITSR